MKFLTRVDEPISKYEFSGNAASKLKYTRGLSGNGYLFLYSSVKIETAITLTFHHAFTL